MDTNKCSDRPPADATFEFLDHLRDALGPTESSNAAPAPPSPEVVDLERRVDRLEQVLNVAGAVMATARDEQR